MKHNNNRMKHTDPGIFWARCDFRTAMLSRLEGRGAKTYIVN